MLVYLPATLVLVIVGERLAARYAPGALVAPLLAALAPFLAAPAALLPAALIALPVAAIRKAVSV